MKYLRKRGSTSNIIRVFIQDNSQTDGRGLTGLTNSSTNLQIAVIRELSATATLYTGTNLETITTIGTFQAPSTSAKCRFKAVDGTNMPGVYEIHFHDDAGHFGTSDASNNLQIYIFEITTTALKIAPCTVEVQLIAFDTQDAVRLGLTALPNAAAEAAGGLYTRGTGAGQINQPGNGKIDANAVQWNGTNVASPDTAGYPVVTIKDGSGQGEILTTSGKVDNVALVDTTTTNSDMRGTDNAALASVCTEGRLAELDAANLPTTTDAILADTGTDGVVVAAASKTGYALSSAGVQAIWDALTSALTTVNSIGKKLADWVLGTDSKVILSNNAHTGAVIPNVTLVATTTTNTDMRGTDGAYTGTPPTAVAIRQEIDSNSTQLAAVKAKTDNLPSGIKKNTALANFTFFMVDSTDHITGKTGLTITAMRSIDGAAFASCANAVTEISGGVYSINLAASDMNGDTITLKFSSTGADNRIIMIVTEP